MLNKKLLGLKSKQKGKASEKLFANMCEVQGIHYVRIEDGGFVNKQKIFIRKKQICDFIFFLSGKAYLIDIKSYGPEKIIYSKFFGSEKGSTQRQTKNFIDIYKRGKFKNLGFIFLPEDGFVKNIKRQPFYFLSAGSLNSAMPFKGAMGSKKLREHIKQYRTIKQIGQDLTLL